MGAVIQKSEISIGNARIEIVMQGGFSEHGSHRTVDMHCHPNFEIHYIEEMEKKSLKLLKKYMMNFKIIS